MHFPSPCLLSALVLLLPSQVIARVTRMVVETRTPASEARYLKLTGRCWGELDPDHALNGIINDLRLAPRNAHGKVEYSATFTLLLPADPAKMSGLLLYEVPNRGNSPLNARTFADDTTAGHALLSSGWQGDLVPRPGIETLTVPVARNADGSSLEGPVLARLSNLAAGGHTASLTSGFAGLAYQRPTTLDTSKALLTRQASDDGQVVAIPSADWAFADCSETPFPGRADPTKICLKGGFSADVLYQVVYTAKDPLVLGIGLAATRDIVSFFRHARHDDDGTPNPLAARIRHAIGSGTSQSGNFVKTMIHLGFNQDEDGRRVWDGVNANIAARLTPLNFRFAIPGGAAGLFEPGSEGVLWWGPYKDEVRHRKTASLLDRCRATRSCPKIMETFGSAEFWGLRMAPGLAGTDGAADIPLPAEVRRYYFPGVTHGGGGGGFRILEAGPAARNCLLPENPNSTAEVMRALRKALIEWVVKGDPPPPSVYPRVDRGELVPPVHQAMGFPVIPGVPLPDNLANGFPIYDFGPGFRDADLSGVISVQPPVVRGTVPMVVPRTDADGNEVGGVPLVLNQAPLGSYLGWNVTASGYQKGRGCGFSGGLIPFARTKAERLERGDPRLSIEERYGTHEGYVAGVRAAARRLVEMHLLLDEDARRLVREADASQVLR
ncbi:MAG TPA: alpha/beta hydrolase domain-containing protein [Paludibaculum sp.]